MPTQQTAPHTNSAVAQKLATMVTHPQKVAVIPELAVPNLFLDPRFLEKNAEVLVTF